MGRLTRHRTGRLTLTRAELLAVLDERLAEISREAHVLDRERHLIRELTPQLRIGAVTAEGALAELRAKGVRLETGRQAVHDAAVRAGLVPEEPRT